VKVVIFCGGQGLRLRDFSENIPKPLVPVGNRPVLWHLMRWYAHFGHREFILCLGYRADAIKDFFLHYEEAASNDFVLRGGGREIELLSRDIDDWTITFVDTGVSSSIGERLRQVAPFLEGEEMFLANYSDGLTDLNLDTYLDWFHREYRVGSFLAAQPPQSYHVATIDPDGWVSDMGPMGKADLWINAGYFAFRSEIFDYLRPGEDLVVEPFRRLIEQRRLSGYRYTGFWEPLDTFKDKVRLDELASTGRAPWELWKPERR